MAVMVSNRVSTLEESPYTSSASEFGLSRQDTEQLLEYYQSEDAGRTYVNSESSDCSESPTGARSPMHARNAEKDVDGNVARTSMDSVASSSGGVQRRTSQRSAGGADKRRVAVVELDVRHEPHVSALLDQLSDTSGSFVQPRSRNLFVRRGVQESQIGNLAIVAPPGAQLLQYPDLSPIPSSAPPTGTTPIVQPPIADPPPSKHQRSMSDAPSQRKGSFKTFPRDVGIVGTLGTMHFDPSQDAESLCEEIEGRPSTSDGCRTQSDALTAPVFQTPRSRSPSPLPLAPAKITTPESSSSVRGQTIVHGQQFSPTSGLEKEMGRTAVGPVVLDLTSGQPMIGRSPRSMASGLPAVEPSSGSPHLYGDRDTQRSTARLPFKPNQSSLSYLHYQPGLHATAGPLPSPPRQILTLPTSSPPPRPPRLLSPPRSRRRELGQTKASTKVEHLDELKMEPITSLNPIVPSSLGDSDYSISAVSASSSGSEIPALSPNTTETSEPASTPSSDNHQPRLAGTSRSGSHVREGAFPVSSVFLSHPSQLPPSQTQQPILDELVASVIEPVEQESSSCSSFNPTSISAEPSEPEPLQTRPELRREESWVSLHAESSRGEPGESSPSSYGSSREDLTRVTTTAGPPGEGRVQRKRASLPVPPSQSHSQRQSLHRTPSLLAMSHPGQSQMSSLSSYPRKAPSSWPDAMNFYDILSKRSAVDRAFAYSMKFRELASEETGLRDWLLLLNRKERREQPSSALSPTTMSRVFAKQPRHISRGSIASEVTFPIRQDSYTATDLSPRPSADVSIPISPTSLLPYPSLAQGVGVRRHPSRTMLTDSATLSATSSRSLGGMFFASIGRKSSIKKDRSFTSTSPTKLLASRRPQQQPPQPRPIKLGMPPTLPGGPRAPARVVLRANSIVFNSPVQSSPEGPNATAPLPTTVESTEAFNLKVEQLFDLLPHADKDILAGYLRRATNQDPMSAIGTYLEDEKQGCLRRN